jgi:PAS domain S-box-containing protein
MYGITAAILAMVVVLDLMTPLELVVWPLYLVPGALYGGRWSPRVNYLYAASCTALLFLPFLFPFDHPFTAKATANQAIGVAVLWAFTSFVVLQGRKEREARALREEMEEKDRRRAEELESANGELREREEVLSTFFRNAPLMMGVVGMRDGKVHHVSGSSTCLSSLESLSNDVGSAPSAGGGNEPRELALWREKYAASRRTGLPVRFDYLHEEGGEGRWISAMVCHISTGPDGTPRFCYLAEDATERKKGEQLLRESERRYRSLVSQLPDIVYMVSPGDGERPFFVSDQIEAVLGYGADEWISGAASREKCTHENDRARVMSEWRRFREGGGSSFASQYRMVARDGRVVWVNEKAKTFGDEEGRPALVQGIVTDISQFKEMERVAFLQEKMVSLGHLAAGIAHEIRNPLSGVNIYLRMVGEMVEEEGVLPPDRKEAAKNVIASALAASDKIEEVVKKVLNYSRPGIVPMRRVPMHRVLKDAVDFTLIGIRRRNLRIDVEIPEDLPECHADGRLLEQVIWNLVLNASQSIEESGLPGVVRVSAAVEGGDVVVRVGDSGPGIPGEIRERLFEPFFTTKAAGMGIGLNFCRRVMTDHGGTLEVGDSPLGGAEFRFSLPVGERRRASRTAEGPAAGGRPAAPAAGAAEAVPMREAR